MNRAGLVLALVSVAVLGCGGDAFESLTMSPGAIDAGSDDPQTEPADDGSNPPQDGPTGGDDQPGDRTPDPPSDGSSGAAGHDSGGAGGAGGTGGTSPGTGGAGGTGGTSPGTGGAGGTGGTSPGTGGAGGTGGSSGGLPDGSSCAGDDECASGFCDGQPDAAALCVGSWTNATGTVYQLCGNQCPDPLQASCGCGSLVVALDRLWRCRMACTQIQPGFDQGGWSFVRGPLLPTGATVCVSAGECASGVCNKDEEAGALGCQ